MSVRRYQASSAVTQMGQQRNEIVPFLVLSLAIAVVMVTGTLCSLVWGSCCALDPRKLTFVALSLTHE